MSAGLSRGAHCARPGILGAALIGRGPLGGPWGWPGPLSGRKAVFATMILGSLQRFSLLFSLFVANVHAAGNTLPQAPEDLSGLQGAGRTPGIAVPVFVGGVAARFTTAIRVARDAEPASLGPEQGAAARNFSIRLRTALGRART